MSSKPSPDFSVHKGNRPIIDISPKNTISTGISYGRQIRGFVPYFEEYDAMVEAGYNLLEWMELDYLERVDVIAYKRLKKLISLHENDSVQTYLEKQRRRKARKRR